MKKWFAIAGFFISLLALIWYMRGTDHITPKHSFPVESKENPPPTTATPVDESTPPKVMSEQIVPPLVETLPRDYGLQVGRKSYKLNQELVAISVARAQSLGLSLHQKLGGWAIVSRGDLNSNELEMYSVLEREENGHLAVFRGVLRAQSLEILDENSSTQGCGGSVLSAHPEIKIYLFQLSGDQNPDEFKRCLDESRLFSRLEWEVLDQPRLAR